MLNQDDNKRLTVDSAIFNYSHLVSSLLYVDRDELLFCPEGTYHVETQRAYQHDFIRRVLFQHNHDQILFQRFNYASVVNLLSSKEFSSSASSSNASSSSSLTDQYIQQVLESCIINSYQKRSIFAFFHCFSSVTIYKSKEKCLFQTNSCPFHELHHACLRCRCKTIPVTKPSNIQK